MLLLIKFCFTVLANKEFDVRKRIKIRKRERAGLAEKKRFKKRLCEKLKKNKGKIDPVRSLIV